MREPEANSACYKLGRIHDRVPAWSAEKPNGRWRAYDYADLLARDKLVLIDLFWNKDGSLTDVGSFPPPEVIALEIVDDLEGAMTQFRMIVDRLTG